MTTIAYRDGVMAGDSRAYSGNRAPIGNKVKVERLRDGTLLGVSSTVPGGAETVRRWWDDRDLDLPSAFSLLAVKPNGDVYYASDTPHLSGPLRAPFFAIGSGNELALGAMEMGAAAVEAVRAAAKHDPWTGLPIYAVRHDAAARWRVDR